MSQNKNAYFQNGQGADNPNTPTPKKKKYKSEKAIVVQPRFEEPLYRNYDLYETEGINGKPKHGPGVGWHDMHKFKSIKEFLDSRRKKLKDKYKADDSWIEDDGSKTKKSKAQCRMALLTKLAIDFKIDDQIQSAPILPEGTGYSNEIGGILDKYTPLDDFEGKSADKLNFGRDYAEDAEPSDEDLEKLDEKYKIPAEPDLFGLPDGISPPEDRDADFTVNNKNPQYGTTDSGNTTYDKLSF